MRGYSKFTYEIRTGRNVAQVALRALQLAQTEPKGPAYIFGCREVMWVAGCFDTRRKNSRLTALDTAQGGGAYNSRRGQSRSLAASSAASSSTRRSADYLREVGGCKEAARRYILVGEERSRKQSARGAGRESRDARARCNTIQREFPDKSPPVRGLAMECTWPKQVFG